jgi:hypothetical protein
MQERARERRKFRRVRQVLTWPRAGLVAAVLFAMSSSGKMAAAESSAEQRASPEGPATVLLEYKETSYPMLARDVSVKAAPNRLLKEPAPAAGQVFRGVMQFGNSPSNALAFVWQTEPRRLFLDLNRNFDLTDDPAGMFSGRAAFAVSGAYHQVFTNVPLSFPATSRGAPMLVNLELSCSERDRRVVAIAELRSFWQSKVTWGGQEWQLGLLPNLSDSPGSFRQGQVLLRPWEERNRAFQGACEPLDARMMGGYWRDVMLRAPDTFAVGPRVFFAGQTCQLDWTAEPQGCREKFVLRLTGQPTALGEMKISGSHIRRLVLEGEPCLVVLAHPEASVRVPVGRYYPRCVWLQKGRTEAYFRFGVLTLGKTTVLDEVTGAQLPVMAPPPPERVVVDERRPGMISVGGPLTNCVSATHRGRELFLSYKLLGAGGGEYRPVGRDFEEQPQFTIREGGLRVGAGKFEFG